MASRTKYTKDDSSSGSYFPQPPVSPSSLSPWSSLMMSGRNQNSGGRKRALSRSPSEVGFDVESLTRSSEACLRLSVNSGGGGANRDSCNSSNTSGSYGHLIASAFGLQTDPPTTCLFHFSSSSVRRPRQQRKRREAAQMHVSRMHEGLHLPG